MVLSASFSELLGYTSIACWLGAQFPQVLENARRQSVEGLALPFLMNWLLGDATNLLGCILTHQLPFQTYLATYFVFVDFSLLSQYFYYRQPTEKPLRPPYLHSRDRTASVATRRHSFDRGAGAPHYRALSTVAANVAAVAALAAQQEEQARWHHRRSHSIEPRSASYDDEEEVSEDALARLAESFHSEGGRSGRRKHVAWGQDSFQGRSRHSTTSPPAHMHSSLHMTVPPSPMVDDAAAAAAAARGRPLVRAADAAELGDEEWLSGNAHRRSSRASRKGATMVFLGVWALFGVGAFTGGRKATPSGVVEHTGRIWTRDVPAAVVPEATSGRVPSDSVLSAPPLPSEPLIFDSRSAEGDVSILIEPPPTVEHIIGRISAWICTTLYLTSRLPQIWKNYVRKSVEGLSIYLFIFAFLGNFFYVASILTSPNLQLPAEEAAAFMRESIPYLLGSGGTLMFDVTIVAQSLLYRAKPLIRGRGLSRTYSEEEAGLLAATAAAADASGAEGSPVTSRRRAGSLSRDPPAGL
ncbi:PQ loop repeat-domain-containing protein [Trametes polyzona]|nr:PQ loop repeat-domain-containing protein [Trametes polyzona]